MTQSTSSPTRISNHDSYIYYFDVPEIGCAVGAVSLQSCTQAVVMPPLPRIVHKFDRNHSAILTLSHRRAIIGTWPDLLVADTEWSAGEKDRANYLRARPAALHLSRKQPVHDVLARICPPHVSIERNRERNIIDCKATSHPVHII